MLVDGPMSKILAQRGWRGNWDVQYEPWHDCRWTKIGKKQFKLFFGQVSGS